MSGDLGPLSRTRVRRLAEKARYDEATIFSILDAAPYCHVASIVDGRALALPTLHLREDRRLYLHGSQSNALLRSALDAGEATVSATIYDGLRLARSGFESSVAYRSVVAFGTVSAVDDATSGVVLSRFLDAVVPGRAAEVRALTEREQRLTLVVAFDIVEASAKVSAGPTDDDDSDAALELWSGVVPSRMVYSRPIPSFDGAMAQGLAVPDSVRALIEPTGRVDLSSLAAEVAAIDPVDPRERESIAAMLDRLNWGDDPLNEGADPRHVTASAIVVSPRGVLLHRHRILGIWVQPGGHVDAGEHPRSAARREVLEETGLVTTELLGEVFHVDVHQGPRGHTHFDVRYLLGNDGDDPAPPVGESPDVFWFDFDAAIERAEPSLRAVLTKARETVLGLRGTL